MKEQGDTVSLLPRNKKCKKTNLRIGESNPGLDGPHESVKC